MTDYGKITSYKIVKGGLDDIPDNSKSGKIGIIYKLYNKQDVEQTTKIIEEGYLIKLHRDYHGMPFEIQEINIYHKPYSIYKWVTYIIDAKIPAF